MRAMDWGDLTRELDFWSEEARVAQFWWRDDDAAEPLPALARLLDLAASFELELGLAVVPQWATEALADGRAGALLDRWITVSRELAPR